MIINFGFIWLRKRNDLWLKLIYEADAFLGVDTSKDQEIINTKTNGLVVPGIEFQGRL